MLSGRRSTGPAMRPAGAGTVPVAMACPDAEQVGQVARLLGDFSPGCLMTYARAEDLILNAPQGTVALVVLATDDSADGLRRALRWLRGRRPGCPIAVVDGEGRLDRELAAREGGALYLTAPVPDSQWSAVLEHAIRMLPAAAGRWAGGLPAHMGWPIYK